jgi:23S rRNA (adenine2503-C2)-methyltransferase
MKIEKLEEMLKDEPKYRVKQANEAVFVNLIEDWNEATVFSLSLRERLNKECPLNIQAENLVSKTGDNVKARINLADGVKIETVLMRHNDGRNTVCVSSQAGCSLGCKFCATGKMGFVRNLIALEIVEQVIFFSRLLKKENARVSNIVFMGMGEPFLNYEEVMKAVKILNAKDRLNIGARHISISTVGLTEGIKKLQEEKLQINLAISLHAPNDALRTKIIPSNAGIKNILIAVDEYIKKTKRQVMFEYLLIKGVNDSEVNAKELAGLMKKPLYFLNLILYNFTGDFEPPPTQTVKKFKEVLEKEGIRFSERYRFGQDIKAACGQFSGS